MIIMSNITLWLTMLWIKYPERDYFNKCYGTPLHSRGIILNPRKFTINFISHNDVVKMLL